MKKVKYVVLLILCFCLIGCNNEFAKEDYDDTEKIVATSDHYAMEI